MNSKDSLFKEIEEHLLNDDVPSEFFSKIKEDEIFKKVKPFDALYALVDTPQSPKYHPEGSVWNHTLLVSNEAAKRKGFSEDPKAFMWCALLHDIGKPPTTKIRKGRITSYDHDKVGARIANNFLREFFHDEAFIHRVTVMVRWHMQPLYVLKGLPFAEIEKMKKEISIEEISLFSLCDRLGRGGITEEKRIEEEKNAEDFLRKCNKDMLKV